MNRQPNRLPAEGEHRFKGSEIDRARPLGFRLDGREIRGYAGDTLLSALLASGIVGAGSHDGETLALDERFAPPVLLRGHTHDRLRALSLERTPAIDGLDFVTLGHARHSRLGRATGLLTSLLPGRRGRLGLNFDDDSSLTDPWFDAPPQRDIEADVVIVGGGLAGMSAAVAAARRGRRVVLIERRRWLGGEARLFGSEGDAADPQALVKKLAETIAGLANLTVLHGAEAFAVFPGTVRVNQVVMEGGIPASQSLAIVASRIVLAAGSLERLPIFAGNRGPGVVGVAAAFERADRFGVWIGRRSVIGTATNVGYRVMMPALDAGITLERIIDTRLNPQSRFIEFSKAYGVAMARDLRPRRAVPEGRAGIAVYFDHQQNELERPSERYAVDQLVVSGGWQPNLTLWHMAGGTSRWSAANHRLEAEGSVAGIVLAGSMAGYRNAAACVGSGQGAIASLYGRSMPDIDDTQIDPIYETPDDPTPIGRLEDGAGNSYLDGGTSLAERPAPTRQLRLWPGRRVGRWSLAEQARPLGVADVAAGVQLGAIPPDEAAIVAQERCVTPGDIVDAGRAPLPERRRFAAPAGTPPPYLVGRFGVKPAIWLVEPGDGRRFDVGCLIFANTDSADPLAAAGVVFAPSPNGRAGGLALIHKGHRADATLFAKDISGPVPVRLVDPAIRAEQSTENPLPPLVADGAATGSPAGGESIAASGAAAVTVTAVAIEAIWQDADQHEAAGQPSPDPSPAADEAGDGSDQDASGSQEA